MLIDSTLREGQQQYGVFFTRQHKEAILRHSLAAGLDEVELGVVGDEDVPALLTLAHSLRAPHQHISVWTPARPKDIAAAAKLSATRVCMSVPVSDEHLKHKLRTDRAGLLGHLANMLDMAKAQGITEISVGLEDVTRADLDFALRVAKLAQSKGAKRIRLADTVGLLTPDEMKDLVRRFSRAVRVDLAVHCHNDFGLATANTLAALEAGADYADTCALGLGERAGLASLEQVAGFLALRRGDARYDLTEIREVCGAAASGTREGKLPDHAPVVGEQLFWVESGLHVDGLTKKPELYEPFDPTAVGLGRKLAVGSKSGRGAVRSRMSALKISSWQTNDSSRLEDSSSLDELVARVRQTSRALGRSLSDEELVSLAS